jgi:hypothetical protein
LLRCIVCNLNTKRLTERLFINKKILELQHGSARFIFH